MPDDISPGELRARLDQKQTIVLLDVRDEWETRLCRLETLDAHSHRGDRAPDRRAESRRRDRRVLPPRGPERGGGQLSPRARLRQGGQPRRRPRSVGASGRPVHEAILMAGSECAFVRVDRRGACAWVTLGSTAAQSDRSGDDRGTQGRLRRARDDSRVRAAVLTGSGRATTAGMQLQLLREPHRARREGAHRVAPRGHPRRPRGPVSDGLHDERAVPGRRIRAGDGLRHADGRDRRGHGVARDPRRRPLRDRGRAACPLLIGPGRAAECLLTGESITAAQALEWGLVNRVAPAAQLEPGHDGDRRSHPRVRAHRGAPAEGADRSAGATRTCGAPSSTAINAFAQAYATDEPREAMRAFLDKRPPRFE